MLNLVINLSRINKQLIMLLVDSMLLVSILLASFSIRLGYWYFPQDDLIWVVLGAPVVASIILLPKAYFWIKHQYTIDIKQQHPISPMSYCNR